MKLKDVRGLMQPDEVKALAKLAGAVPQWASIVEIGTHTGLSTCWMADAARRGGRAHLTAIDPYPAARPDSRDDPYELGQDGSRQEMLANLTALDLWPWVTPLRGYSLDVAQLWQSPIGLLFIDAVHELDALTADYGAWADHVIQGGVLALHDYNETDYPGVVSAVSDVILPTGQWIDVRLTSSLWTAVRTRTP